MICERSRVQLPVQPFFFALFDYVKLTIPIYHEFKDEIQFFMSRRCILRSLVPSSKVGRAGAKTALMGIRVGAEIARLLRIINRSLINIHRVVTFASYTDIERSS